MSAKSDSISQQINNIKENLIELSNRLSKLENANKWNYSSETVINPQTRFLKREEIIDCLLRLNANIDKIYNTTNYKQLLEDELKSRNFKGKINLLNTENFFKRNNIQEMNDDLKGVKEGIMEMIQKRRAEYENRK
jgi:hypothetical protein